MITKTLFSYTSRGISDVGPGIRKKDELYCKLGDLMHGIGARSIFEGEIPPFRDGDVYFGYWHALHNNVKVSYMNMPKEHRVIRLNGPEIRVEGLSSLVRSELREFRPREKVEPSLFERLKVTNMGLLESSIDKREEIRLKLDYLERVS